jgi:hypothetical protein
MRLGFLAAHLARLSLQPAISNRIIDGLLRFLLVPIPRYPFFVMTKVLGMRGFSEFTKKASPLVPLTLYGPTALSIVTPDLFNVPFTMLAYPVLNTRLALIEMAVGHSGMLVELR